MYCSGCGLGADSPFARRVGGAGVAFGGNLPTTKRTGDPTMDALRAWSSGRPLAPPVLKKFYVTCKGITYNFPSQAIADEFNRTCNAAPGAPAGGTPSQPPATGGGTPGTDYNNPSTWPTAPNLPAPSPATGGQINSIPSGGGGGAMIDDSAAGPVQAAGMFGNIPPLALVALAAGAFLLLRKRR